MKIVIHWEYFQRYHNARVTSLIRHNEKLQNEILPVSLSTRGFHGHQPERDSYVDAHTTYLRSDSDVRPIDDPSIIHQFIQLLDKEQPDVVSVVGWYGKGTRRIIRWAQKNNKGTVMMLAGSQHDKKRLWIKEAYKRFIFMPKIGAVICGGISHLRYAKQLGMPERRIFTGYNSVDNDFWASQASAIKHHPGQFLGRVGLKANNYFISVGRFIKKKNFEALIEQYANYRRSTNGNVWDLVIAGDGPLKSSVESKIQACGIANNVKLVGYLSSNELAPYMALAGAFVLPSSGFEQWGLVVNEAMASGLPVIVSNICGCCEDLVVNGKTGYSFSPNSIDELQVCLRKMSENTVARNRMAKEAEKHILNYSPEVFARNFTAACEIAARR